MSFDSVFHGAPTSNDGQAVPSGRATLGIDVTAGTLYYKNPADPTQAGWQAAAVGSPLPSGSGNQVVATPDGSSGSAFLRAITAADLPTPRALTTQVLGWSDIFFQRITSSAVNLWNGVAYLTLIGGTLFATHQVSSQPSTNNVDLYTGYRGTDSTPTGNFISFFNNLGNTKLFGVDINGNLLLKASNPPASASATGQTGQIAWDAGFFYVCIATNTWVRTALATW